MKDIKPKYEKYFMLQKKLTSETGKTIQVLNYNTIPEFVNELVNDDKIKFETKVLIGLLLSGGLRVSEALDLKKTDFFVADTKKGKRNKYHIGVLKKRKKLSYANVLTQKIIDLEKDSSKKTYRKAVQLWIKFLNLEETSSIKGEFNTFHDKKLQEFKLFLEKDEEINSKNCSKYINTISSLKKYYDFMKDPKGGIKRLAMLNPAFDELFRRWKNKLGNSKYIFDFCRSGALSRVQSALGKGVTNHAFRHSYISYKLFGEHNQVSPHELSKRMRIGLSVIQSYTHVDEYAAVEKDWN